MNNFNHLIINKNRGWRGLAEAKVLSLDADEEIKMIFSFSQPVWDDLIVYHKLVMQDTDYYYVIYFEDDHGLLPTPSQQRSVLIKSFNTKISKVNRIDKKSWTSSEAKDYSAIVHFIKNKNNHTQSDWNCIGVRVYPEI